MEQRTKQRLLSIIMMLMLAAGTVPFTGDAFAAVNVTAKVSSAGLEYSSQKALEYAKKTWNVDPYKVDCINYVRRCNEAGGVKTRSCTIPNYIKYLTEGGYADYYKLKTVKVKLKGSTRWYVREKDNAGKIAPGDAVVWKCNKCGRSWHIAIVAPADKTGACAGYCRYYAHNGPINNGLISKNKHSRSYCSTPAENTELYVVHFRSVENGFVNNGSTYSVITRYSDLNMRTGPGTSYKAQGTASKDVELVIKSTSGNWGQLACNNLWICLDYTEKVGEDAEDDQNKQAGAGSTENQMSDSGASSDNSAASTTGSGTAASTTDSGTAASTTGSGTAAATTTTAAAAGTVKPAATTTAAVTATAATKKPAAKADPTFKIKMTKSSKIRKKASSTGKKAGTAKKGKTYTIKAVKNGWGQISGSGYWVNLKNASVKSGYKVKISYNDLNMRTGPGLKYKRKGYVKPGNYQVTAISGAWCKLSNGYWVKMQYTQKV